MLDARLTAPKVLRMVKVASYTQSKLQEQGIALSLLSVPLPPQVCSPHPFIPAGSHPPSMPAELPTGPAQSSSPKQTSLSAICQVAIYQDHGVNAGMPYRLAAFRGGYTSNHKHGGRAKTPVEDCKALKTAHRRVKSSFVDGLH